MSFLVVCIVTDSRNFLVCIYARTISLPALLFTRLLANASVDAVGRHQPLR
jgi:hypothetical protein